MIRVFSAKKAVWLAALAVGLSAAIIAPALAVQSSLTLAGSSSYIPEEAASENLDESSASPSEEVSSPSLNLSAPSGVADPDTVPAPSDPVAVPSPAPVTGLTATPRFSTPEPQETSSPTPTQTPVPTQAPTVQQPVAGPVVGTVSVSQVTPENGLGEAILQWSSIPGITEYRIYKTGTIRPSWRLFYVYPPSVTSITIFDQPGSIAIYKIMVVIDFKETLLGEVTYQPTR